MLIMPQVIMLNYVSNNGLTVSTSYARNGFTDDNV